MERISGMLCEETGSFEVRNWDFQNSWDVSQGVLCDVIHIMWTFNFCRKTFARLSVKLALWVDGRATGATDQTYKFQNHEED